MSNTNMILAICAILAIGAIIYLFMSDNQPKGSKSNFESSSNSNSGSYSEYVTPTQYVEPFENEMPEYTEHTEVMSNFANTGRQNVVSGSEEIGYNEQPQSLGFEQNGTQLNHLPSECYPKDVLSSVDLLPQDANSLWAQVSPSGQGSLADQNFLTSGFHIGINTVGQTLRNANRQLRSEPLNPQVKVSPWQQTTIEADINRRPLEIGSGDL